MEESRLVADSHPLLLDDHPQSFPRGACDISASSLGLTQACPTADSSIGSCRRGGEYECRAWTARLPLASDLEFEQRPSSRGCAHRGVSSRFVARTQGPARSRQDLVAQPSGLDPGPNVEALCPVTSAGCEGPGSGLGLLSLVSGAVCLRCRRPSRTGSGSYTMPPKTPTQRSRSTPIVREQLGPRFTALPERA